MLLYTIPPWVQLLFPSITWKVKTAAKEVFLTFDDGPHPTITPWVLHELDRYGAKATFFCVGENAERYREVLADVARKGHRMGNHTYRHLDGWKVGADEYLKDIAACAQVVESNLFRPPYGRLPFTLLTRISTKYRIIMWNILSGDYDKDLDVHKSFKRIKKYLRPGSVIVFHDSDKAVKNMKVLLPQLLQHLSREGYTMRSL